MKLVLERSSCGNGRTCPSINSTDRSTYVVQGHTETDQQGPRSTMTTVEVPLTLLPELSDRPVRSGLEFTAKDSVLITGQRLHDLEVWDELDLPEGEDVVEVPFALLAELKETQLC